MCCSICVQKDYIFYILIRCIHIYHIYVYYSIVVRICLVDEFSILEKMCFRFAFMHPSYYIYVYEYIYKLYTYIYYT